MFQSDDVYRTESKKNIINFHNTLNRNLFSKKNYKIMKKFYSTKEFYGANLKKNQKGEEETTTAEIDPKSVESKSVSAPGMTTGKLP